jgi:membrane protease subunit HflC
MQAYKSIIEENTTLVLSTDSDLFKFLKGMDPGDGDAVRDLSPSENNE